MPAAASFHDLIAANTAYRLEAQTPRPDTGARLTTCRFVAHDLQSPALPELVLLASHEYQLSTAMVDLGWGYHDHFSSAPHPVHVIPPDTPFRWIKDGAARVTFLSIDKQSAADYFEQLEVSNAANGLWMLAQKGFANPFLYASIIAFAEQAARSACPRLLADSYCVTILNALAQQWRRHDERQTGRSAPRLNARALKLALEMIEQDLAQDFSLDHLAQACGMTKYHFIRCFKASTGVSPYHYLLQRRIERAKQLMGATNWPLERIAAQVGYQDPDSLARLFRRQEGLSPAAWRRAN
ncbi:helix-turn-helix domain-containing protein [Kerstersia sp.]|uniref:helix-turn-helix domain-containing protein n=1 Tax=Kerstersia sp. TaxID=1930783 RepID=UPI003F9303AC